MEGWREGVSRGRQTHNLKCHAVGITLSPELLALWGNKHTSTNERTVEPKHGRRYQDEFEVQYEEQNQRRKRPNKDTADGKREGKKNTKKKCTSSKVTASTWSE